MTNQKQSSTPSGTEREPGTREDGEAMPPAAIDPGTDDRPKTKGIPPLPEPDVEGVGNEGGTSSADKAKMVKDATGF